MSLSLLPRGYDRWVTRGPDERDYGQEYEDELVRAERERDEEALENGLYEKEG